MSTPTLSKWSFSLLIALFLFQWMFPQALGDKHSQKFKKVDSLRSVIGTASSDTVKARAYIELAKNFFSAYPDSSAKALYDAFYIAEGITKENSGNNASKTLYLDLIGNGFHLLGDRAAEIGDTKKLMEYMNMSLKIKQEIGDKKGMAATYNNMAGALEQNGEIKAALKYFDLSIQIMEETGDKKGLAASLNNLGLTLYNRGNLKQAELYLDKSFATYTELKDKKGIAFAMNNLALVYNAKGNDEKTIKYFIQSMKLREEMGDKKAVAASLNNLGGIFNKNGDPVRALEYLNKGLKIREEIGDKAGVAISLQNIGSVNRKLGDLEKALGYFMQSLEISKSIRDVRSIGKVCNSIGVVYETQKQYQKAFSYYSEALTSQEKNLDKDGMATTLSNLSSLFAKQKQYSKAIAYGTKALALSKEIGSPDAIKASADKLSKIYRINGQFEKALENYELYILMRDSLQHQASKRETINAQLQYEFDRKSAADSVAYAKENQLKDAELQRQEAVIQAKKNQQYGLIGGLALVAVFAGFMYNRFKVTQKQKVIIEEQKRLVEIKQKEVTDSIRYAKRIQMALLPSERFINKILQKKV